MPDTPDPETAAGDATPPEVKPAGEPLGDGGLKALQAERDRVRELQQQIKELKPLAERARERDDADKSEVQRLTERLTAAEKAQSEANLRAMRLEVAGEEGLTVKQARRLTGTTVDELKADAADLKAAFQPADQQPPPKVGARRPRETGSTVTGDDVTPETEETDPGKLADLVAAQRLY